MSSIRVGVFGDRVNGEWCSPSFQLRLLTAWLGVPWIKIKIIECTSDLEDIDVVVFQRLSMLGGLGEEIFLETIGRKIPRVLDIDDDFHGVANSDSHEQKGSAMLNLAKYEDFLAKFSQIWVSTENLGSIISSRSGMAVRLRPTVPPRFIERQIVQRTPRQRTRSLLYFGTPTHANDFETVRLVLERESKRESILSTVVGVGARVAIDPAIQVVGVPRKIATRYSSFMDFLQRLGPFDIGISPIATSDVNRSKSGLKVMEYAALGILPVASNSEAYSWLSQLGLGSLLVDHGIDNWDDKITYLSELNFIDFEELRYSAVSRINLYAEKLRVHNLSEDSNSLTNLIVK